MSRFAADLSGAMRDRNDTYSPRTILLGLAIVLILVLGGLYLVYALRDQSSLQDCVMQGRSNCAPQEALP